MSTTPDGLVSFRSYLSNVGGQNTGQPPYTIKAKDLDTNFQMVTVRPPAASGVGKSAAYTVKITPVGTELQFHVVTLHVCVNGVDKQIDVLALGDPY
jgi:hypothetical protein